MPHHIADISNNWSLLLILINSIHGSVHDLFYLSEDLIESAGGHSLLKVLQQHIIDGPAGVYSSCILLQQVHPFLQDWCKLTEI